MKLDKYDIALAKACATDGRPSLQHVAIRSGELVAANGFLLVTRKADLDEGEQVPDAMIPASIFGSVSAPVTVKPRKGKILPAPPKKTPNLEISDKQGILTYQDRKGEKLENEPEVHFKLGLGLSFPNHQQLFPKGDKVFQIAVSVAMLQKVLSTMPPNGTLRIGFTTEYPATEGGRPTPAPIEFSCDFGERPIEAVLMPMFVDWSDFKWHAQRIRPMTPAAQEHHDNVLLPKIRAGIEQMVESFGEGVKRARAAGFGGPSIEVCTMAVPVPGNKPSKLVEWYLREKGFMDDGQ